MRGGGRCAWPSEPGATQGYHHGCTPQRRPVLPPPPPTAGCQASGGQSPPAAAARGGGTRAARHTHRKQDVQHATHILWFTKDRHPVSGARQAQAKAARWQRLQKIARCSRPIQSTRAVQVRRSPGMGEHVPVEAPAGRGNR